MDAVNEIERQQREERQQIRSDAEALSLMLAHPGWTRYIALVERVAQNYHGSIMKPIESLLEAPKVEFAKGALSGLSLATALPSMKIKEAQELRSQSKDDEE